MKKGISIAILSLILLTASVNFLSTVGSEELRVLVDESRVYCVDEVTCEAYISEIEDIVEDLLIVLGLSGLDVTAEVVCDGRYSFNNFAEPWGFGFLKSEVEKIASVTVRESGTLTYAVLRKYDVLVIASFEKGYTSAEVDAIQQFVGNGGGLFLLADIDSQSDNVSDAFDVLFCPGRAVIADTEAESVEGIKAFLVTDIVNHPITKNVNSIALERGTPIVSLKKGEVLVRTSRNSWLDYKGSGAGTNDAEERGPFDILLALDTTGKGRAVFFGGAGSFQNEVIIGSGQNLNLFCNTVQWLGEPGGPYKQYKKLNAEAQQTLTEALLLYETRKYSEAKPEFDKALEFFTKSHEMYPNSVAIEGITEVQTYILRCETGMEADNAFEGAEDLFANREYEKAIETYEAGKSLYEKIECTERAEECTKRIEDSTAMIALREEATELFSKAENVFNESSNTFSSTQYEEAQSLFEQSVSKWEEYNDPAMVKVCRDRIAVCDERIAAVRKNVIILIGSVTAAVVFLVAVLFLKKRKIQ